MILSRKFASGFEARYPQGLRSVRAKMIELVYSDSELISAINDRVAAERALRKINAYNRFYVANATKANHGFVSGFLLTHDILCIMESCATQY